MSLSEVIKDRKIEEVLHFTTNRGAVGILHTRYLSSRARLSDDKMLEHILHVNAKDRPEASEFFDKSRNWLDYVNLSISEINTSYFRFSRNWHVDKDVWWVILSFDSSVMTHDGVYFATTNNSYSYCTRASGLSGFNALFETLIRRKPNWVVNRLKRESYLPTCEQAEVLYPEKISIDNLKRIYVKTEDNYDVVSGWLGEFNLDEIEVVIDPSKFKGRPN